MKLLKIGEYLQLVSQYILLCIGILTGNIYLWYWFFGLQLIFIIGQFLMVKRWFYYKQEYDKQRFLSIEEYDKKVKEQLFEKRDCEYQSVKLKQVILMRMLLKQFGSDDRKTKYPHQHV